MKKRILPLIGLAAVILLISTGCAGPTRSAMDYGTSFHLGKFNQIANPEAAKNLGMVSGLDGVAAHEAIEKYRKGFQRITPPTPIFSIGGISTGMGMR
jgi:hypothetical protein